MYVEEFPLGGLDFLVRIALDFQFLMCGTERVD